MSFDEQFVRKRQSCHATYTFPAPSISAVGSGSVRRPPATKWSEIVAIVTGLLQLTPPFVERREISAVALPLSVGMITTPFGFTTGCAPITLTAGVLLCVQVAPPSRE